jgi:putative transposase
VPSEEQEPHSPTLHALRKNRGQTPYLLFVARAGHVERDYCVTFSIACRFRFDAAASVDSMPRKPRVQQPETIYHVGSRGVDKQSIFDVVRWDREFFVELLGTTVATYHWRLHAYCLMGNHFHLVLDTPDANIGAGMRYLKGRYAQWFNKVKGREGALFERRYWDRMASSEPYVLALSRYVVLNPVRCGWCRSPEEWPWSSYAATIGLEPAPRFLRTDDLLGWFGGGKTARLQYAEFVHDAMARTDTSDTIGV